MLQKRMKRRKRARQEVSLLSDLRSSPQFPPSLQRPQGSTQFFNDSSIGSSPLLFESDSLDEQIAEEIRRQNEEAEAQVC